MEQGVEMSPNGVHFGVVVSTQYKKIDIGDLRAEIILSADAAEEKFWYVLDPDNRVFGCIGSREYFQIRETGKLTVKKDFLYIKAGDDEKRKAWELLSKNRKIRKLPVIDESGKLLYEYVRSVEAYYDGLEIRCGIYAQGNQEAPRPEKIVVSLTSYGKRMDMVHLAIKSMMEQTLKADAIVLYLAREDSDREIRQEKALIKAGLQIRRHVDDLKPHKKYFYAMREFPDCLIVTVDDDTIYDDRLLEDLYTSHQAYPEAVVCRRGHRMVKRDGQVAPYALWEGCVESRVPEKGICATGVGGILYPCGSFREAFLDKKGILKTSLCGDDLWLKAVELMEGVPVYAIGEIPAQVIAGSQEEALYVENADEKRNDVYLKRLQAYFGVNLADLF